MGQKGWHTRGYLPHYDGYDISQHVVFTLHDSVPDGEAASGDDVLDLGHGSGLLKDGRCADIVANALLFHDRVRYQLQAWCIMPNHVHVLLAPSAGAELGKTVKSWKAFSGASINKMLGRTGPVWAVDYFDRYIRDDAHFSQNKQYIEMNPVAAGLCDSPTSWRHSSAGWS